MSQSNRNTRSTHNSAQMEQYISAYVRHSRSLSDLHSTRCCCCYPCRGTSGHYIAQKYAEYSDAATMPLRDNQCSTIGRANSLSTELINYSADAKHYQQSLSTTDGDYSTPRTGIDSVVKKKSHKDINMEVKHWVLMAILAMVVLFVPLLMPAMELMHPPPLELLLLPLATLLVLIVEACRPLHPINRDTSSDVIYK